MRVTFPWKKRIVTVPLLFLFLLSSASAQNRRMVRVNNPLFGNPKDYLHEIKLPEGFHIELYAENVNGARSMTLSPNGTLFIGTFRARGGVPGKVYALVDRNRDMKADTVYTIASELFIPNGVAFKDGSLYVAEINRILRFDDIENRLDDPPAPAVVNDRYPDNTWHGWKFIRFGPDGKLYVPVGAPCNICEPEQEIFGTITRINPDGSGLEIYARGIRNTVGFDWHPVTKELWFTDNGRDGWGDDRPPEELNHAPRPGLHFGFPYRYGKALVDASFTPKEKIDFKPAALEMPAHTAALGMRFYTGKMFPEKYHNQIFIAQHGSWNRSKPDGYRVVVAFLENNRAVRYAHFATGWLREDDRYWGRPVDVEILPDGSLLISDDFANCVYRVWYGRQ